MFSSFEVSSSTRTWWNPDIASKHAKYRAVGYICLSNCPDDSPPQTGRFNALFRSLKSVTLRHFIGQLLGFLLGKAWEHQSLASFLVSTTSPAFFISLNSAVAAFHKCFGTSKALVFFTGLIPLEWSISNFTGGQFTLSSGPNFSLNTSWYFFRIFPFNWRSPSVLCLGGHLSEL